MCVHVQACGIGEKKQALVYSLYNTTPTVFLPSPSLQPSTLARDAERFSVVHCYVIAYRPIFQTEQSRIKEKTKRLCFSEGKCFVFFPRKSKDEARRKKIGLINRALFCLYCMLRFSKHLCLKKECVTL